MAGGAKVGQVVSWAGALASRTLTAMENRRKAAETQEIEPVGNALTNAEAVGRDTVDGFEREPDTATWSSRWSTCCGWSPSRCWPRC